MATGLLIVSHAPSGNTRRLTEALLRGARHPDVAGVRVRWLPPLCASAADVLAARAVILGTTENFGYMSGALKDFFERIYYPCLEVTQGLPCALWVRAGNDGEGARQSVERILAGLRWKLVQPPLILRGPYQCDWEADCESLGTTIAASLEAGVI